MIGLEMSLDHEKAYISDLDDVSNDWVDDLGTRPCTNEAEVNNKHRINVLYRSRRKLAASFQGISHISERLDQCNQCRTNKKCLKKLLGR